jgi:hypothetical protein
MNTADVDSSSASIPSGNDIEERNEKIVKAVNNYVSNLANELGKSKDDLKGIVAALLKRLKKDEFWKKNEELQRGEIEVTTTNFFEFVIHIENADISAALDSLMDELSSLNVVSPNSRIVPVNYHISDTELKHKFDLNQFVEHIQSVATEWNATKDTNNPNEKYIAPYFCFIQSSGMGKTKLMYEFAQLTRNDPSHKNLSCDLILSSAGIVIPNPKSVFVHKCYRCRRRNIQLS